MSTSPSGTPLAWQRVELKYALAERMAEGIRRFIEPFAVKDAAAGSEPSQRVTSLYLDTPRIDFYRRHVAREADRFKLRVRCYGDCPAADVFFEVKRKVGHVIDKRRARVARRDFEALLARGRVAPETSAQEREHLHAFVWLMELNRAAASMLTTCRREAYGSREADCSARVTLDRELMYQPVARATLEGDPRRWARTPVLGGVLLELKYSGAPPGWMRELALRLGHARVGYSKYVAAVADTIGESESWTDGLGLGA